MQSRDKAVEDLQSALDHAEEWYLNNRLALILTNTAAIQINRQRPQFSRELIMNNVPIKWQKSVKYLGITIDKRLTFREHVTNTMTKATKARGTPSSILRGNSKLNKIRIFRSMFISMILYVAPIWAFASPTNIKRLQVFQNKFLRWECLNS